MAETNSTTSGSRPSRRTALGLLAVILLVAAGLRFWGIGTKELWLDECVSAIAARGSVAQTVGNVAEHDAHPPLYYALLNLSVRAFGRGDGGVRVLSALASVGGVALIYALGAALFGRWVGLLAAAGLAISSFDVYFAQEARFHALATLLVLGLTYVFVRFLTADEGSGWARWPFVVGYALLTAACLYTYYYTAFAVVAHAVWFGLLWLVGRAADGGRGRWLLGGGGPERRGPLFLAAVLVGLVLFVAGWGREVLERMEGAAEVESARYTLASVGQSLRQYVTGPVADWASFQAERHGDPFPERWMLAVLLVPVIGLAAAARQAPGAVLGLAVLALVPFVCVGLLPARPHIFEPKHLVFVAPVVFLMSAAMAVRSRWIGLGLLAVIAVVNLPPLVLLHEPAPEFQKEPWREVVAKIEEGAQPGDVIAVTPPYGVHPLRRYGAGRLPVVQVPAGEAGVRRVRGLISEHEGGIWLVLLRSHVAHPNYDVWLRLAEWEDPTLQVPPGAAFGEWWDRSTGEPPALMAYWTQPDGTEQALFLPLLEGFTTFRSVIGVRRFEPE
ncbi:MAG: glycosyltransferase family 39 protein [bacterium]